MAAAEDPMFATAFHSRRRLGEPEPAKLAVWEWGRFDSTQLARLESLMWLDATSNKSAWYPHLPGSYCLQAEVKV